MLTFNSVSNMFFTNAGAPGASETSDIGIVPLYCYCYDTIGNNLYFCSDNTADQMIWEVVTHSYDSANYTFSGPWASGQTKTVSLSLNGKTACINIPQVYASATSASIATIDTAIPAAYRPVVNSYIPIIAYDDASTVFGALYVPTTGIITISPNAFSGSYTASGNAGWKTISASWIVS